MKRVLEMQTNREPTPAEGIAENRQRLAHSNIGAMAQEIGDTRENLYDIAVMCEEARLSLLEQVKKLEKRIEDIAMRSTGDDLGPYLQWTTLQTRLDKMMLECVTAQSRLAAAKKYIDYMEQYVDGDMDLKDARQKYMEAMK